MRTSQKLTLFGLLALVVAALIGLQLTKESGQFVTLLRSRRAGDSDQGQLVDQRPLETARKLAAEAGTREERKLAAEVVRVADHEVDLAFASALQSAQRRPKSESAAAKPIQARMQRIEARLTANQEKIKQLTAKATSAKASQQQSIQQQLELAQAQLALDQDELADAQQDLARAGGDTHSQIQRLFEEHQAAEHPNGNLQIPSAASNPSETGSSGSNLIAEWTNWRALRGKQAELVQAQQAALREMAELA